MPTHIGNLSCPNSHNQPRTSEKRKKSEVSIARRRFQKIAREQAYADGRDRLVQHHGAEPHAVRHVEREYARQGRAPIVQEHPGPIRDRVLSTSAVDSVPRTQVKQFDGYAPRRSPVKTRRRPGAQIKAKTPSNHSTSARPPRQPQSPTARRHSGSSPGHPRQTRSPQARRRCPIAASRRGVCVTATPEPWPAVGTAGASRPNTGRAPMLRVVPAQNHAYHHPFVLSRRRRSTTGAGRVRVGVAQPGGGQPASWLWAASRRAVSGGCCGWPGPTTRTAKWWALAEVEDYGVVGVFAADAQGVDRGVAGSLP